MANPTPTDADSSPTQATAENYATPPILEESPQVFHCSACGECCSSWNLLIESHKAQHLLKRPWVMERLQAWNAVLKQVSASHYLLPQTSGNVCVFLNDDGRCGIHQHEGIAFKPDECQRFPFATLSLANGGTHTDASAACKTVTEDLLRHFAPIIPEDLAALPPPTDGEGPPAPTTIPKTCWPWVAWFNNESTLPWDHYPTYLAGVRGILIQPQTNTSTALKQIQQWTSAFPHQPPKKASALSNFQIHPQWYRWTPWLFLRKPYKGYTQWLMLLKGTYEDPKRFGRDLALDLKEIQRIPWPDHEFNPELHGFLYNMFQRKKLLSIGHSLQTTLNMACAAYLLIRWYTQALCWIRMEARPNREDLTQAIRLVERYYTGHQPAFLEAFRVNPLLQHVATALLGPP